MNRPSTFQRGFAAVAAVFLVVGLAALGAFMVSFSNTQHLTSAQDVQGSRAYWAARAGLGWGLASLTANSAACPVPPAPFVVEGFTVVVTCTSTTYSDAGVDNVVIYRLVSRANQGTGVGAVERSVAASVEF
jgi:MSHA biogenesis protein MshP